MDDAGRVGDGQHATHGGQQLEDHRGEDRARLTRMSAVDVRVTAIIGAGYHAILPAGVTAYWSDMVEDIESMTVAVAREHGFAGAISEVVGRPVVWVLERMAETNGRTRVPKAFHDLWPDDAALGKFKVAQCLRLCLVPRLARTLKRTPEEVREKLAAAERETRVQMLFGADWPA